MNDDKTTVTSKTDHDSNSALNLLLSDALDMACKMGFSDDCPLHSLEVEPWDSPCSEVCDIYTGQEWRCWAQYFKEEVR